MLSYTVHWVISMLAGALYGASQEDAGFPDIKGGLALGTGLWLFGDELGMPLMGLADGPTAYPMEVHIHSRFAHTDYGLAVALTTQAFIDMMVLLSIFVGVSSGAGIWLFKRMIDLFHALFYPIWLA